MEDENGIISIQRHPDGTCRLEGHSIDAFLKKNIKDMDVQAVFEADCDSDLRGDFVRLDLSQKQLNFIVRDVFYTISKNNVGRGIHAQNSKYPLKRVVKCIKGSARDFLVDLRQGSNTFGRILETQLTSSNNSFLSIPPGFGHGFISLEDQTTMLYLTEGVTAKSDEFGVNINSLGIDLPPNLILSDHDRSLPPLKDL